MTKVVDGKIVLDDPQEFPEELTMESVMEWIRSGKGNFHLAEIGEMYEPILAWNTIEELALLDEDRKNGTYQVKAERLLEVLLKYGFPWVMIPKEFFSEGTLIIKETDLTVMVAVEYLKGNGHSLGTCSTEDFPLVVYGEWVERVLENLAKEIK